MDMVETDEFKYMRRCLELASMAEGLTYPNPMVGAVVVQGGGIIGEGYHLKSGGPHAEVIAIDSVIDKSRLNDSTLYVSLEPCSHFGKTPPCADYIISGHIPRVVVGTKDSSDKVSGMGIARLINAGCNVTVGVLDEECRRLNRRFFTFHEKRRPYITLKWAQSIDGYIDIMRSEGHNAEPTWITGKAERSLVHKWRAEEQSILAGGATVRLDNPRLNVRDWTGNDPLKLILSRSGNIDKNSAVFKEGEETLIFTSNMQTNIPGASIIKLDESGPACLQIASYLYDRGIQSLFVEGGATLLNHFISNGLWDEARIFTGEKAFNVGVKGPVLEGKLLLKNFFTESILEIYLNSTL
jgi:diaminohydroxyphosphoribosylaminopyrimidine deaminase/5-amino-6-(5-phosphoribosylamino)uracil reductase